MKLLYLIGVPGSGKTTVVRKLTRKLPVEVMSQPYITWTQYSTKVCQLGYDRGTFGGTDALGMAAQKHVIEWLKTEPYEFVLAEGDRLANEKFFDAMIHEHVELTVAYLNTPEELVTERRNQRNKKIGKGQNEGWLAGRATKVKRLASTWVNPEWELDGSLTPQELSRQLTRHPVGKQFVRLRRDKA